MGPKLLNRFKISDMSEFENHGREFVKKNSKNGPNACEF